ncbi:conserved hypothetical phage membrane protein [Mycobacterium marinum M]|uniref:Conserved hypothetical phage membrane protein n=1 Tax=Mycobacterium marinum (strain ATCC BAA-535 / M) TaxID=216594 RepID=B2HPK5_MYCMM|nr:conserved hypothetical phage membrane protein [Mycobacterium marinum M]
MTRPIPPGWYPDPSGAPGARYWNGLAWTIHRAPPAARAHAAAPPRTLSSPSYPDSLQRRLADRIAAHPGITAAAVIYLGIGLAFAMDGYWAAMKGWAFLAALVGGPAGLVLLAVRRTKRRREARERCRQHDARLAARAEREHQALLRGDLDVGVFGAYRPEPLSQPDRSPDAAEQMRRTAWQPELSDQRPAVRPNNPAPWHVVTQWPTRQFRGPAENSTPPDSCSAE